METFRRQPKGCRAPLRVREGYYKAFFLRPLGSRLEGVSGTGGLGWRLGVCLVLDFRCAFALKGSFPIASTRRFMGSYK